MKTGKKGIDFLHEPSALAFQTLGSPEWQSGLTGIASVATEDDEDEERDEVLNLCSECATSDRHAPLSAQCTMASLLVKHETLSNMQPVRGMSCHSMACLCSAHVHSK